jgi:GAF domain-containing protein
MSAKGKQGALAVAAERSSANGRTPVPVATRVIAPPRGNGRIALSWTRREVEALLRVSEAAAFSAQLSDVLDVVVAEACHVTRAKAVSILLTAPGGGFRLVASRGLSGDYNRFLQSHFISHGRSSARAAADRLKPVVIDDVVHDRRINRPEAREWKRFALREEYRALISVPLIVGSRSSGVLNLYRAEVGPWESAEIELAATFAQHAASAIDSARLIDSQRRQLEALERLVRVLRDQTHEYANRLHALSGLLALGKTGEAQSFLAQLMTLHHENHASVIERIHNPILAGLLLAQMSVARQRGVEVRLHRGTHLDSLPPSLGGAEAVTIVANLIENAVEAVAGLPASRRRVSVRIVQSAKNVSITVRDWGPGIDTHEEELFLRGRTSKEDHAGIGLALVSEAAASANGSIEIRRLATGTAFLVKLPF